MTTELSFEFLLLPWTGSREEGQLLEGRFATQHSGHHEPVWPRFPAVFLITQVRPLTSAAPIGPGCGGCESCPLDAVADGDSDDVAVAVEHLCSLC